MKSIKERLGQEAYEKRRHDEEERHQEYHKIFGSHLTYIKIHILRPIEAIILKLLHLYKRGYRNFLSIQIVKNYIHLPNLPQALEGFTILQLSDLHIDIDPALKESIKEKLKDISCNICVLTGDYRSRTVGNTKCAIDYMQDLLYNLPRPVYAILGNHDTLDMIDPIESTGTRILLNENTTIKHNNKTILLLGIDDPIVYKTDDLQKALHTNTTPDLTILLSHAPLRVETVAKHGINIMLCGHTHGGQICLPGGHPIVTSGKFPQDRIRGSWQYRNLQGYTSPGTGASGLPIRLNCPPEITLHILTGKKENG